ncbi:hypothetical protein T492DRAFT_46016 [Pavlovales sp. CCMP2436]|nr:hypothetical protein T492DRAFT_46016 [Pavlovales sp. CCMP2436]
MRIGSSTCRHSTCTSASSLINTACSFIFNFLYSLTPPARSLILFISFESTRPFICLLIYLFLSNNTASECTAIQLGEGRGMRLGAGEKRGWEWPHCTCTNRHIHLSHARVTQRVYVTMPVGGCMKEV